MASLTFADIIKVFIL